jgi:Family of unknown function (DUF6084)
MIDLNFHIEGAEPVKHAAAPILAFRLRIAEASGAGQPTPVHAIALRCQIRIEPARRRYVPGEQEHLRDLFGEPQRWGQTLKSMLWTHATVMTPSFARETTVEMQAPCTFDFNIAVSKYFYSLEDGEVPLCLLFSGTVFYETEDDGLQVTQIAWDKEANYRLPVKVWKEMMDLYYPNTAWLCLRRDVFDQLYLYKSRRGLPTWEQAMEELLKAAGRREAP